MRYSLHQWLPLLLLIIGLCLFIYFDLAHYFTFDAVKAYRVQLLDWTREHRIAAVILFLLIYTMVVAVSFPGATIMTLVSGFVFGVLWGTILAVIGATLGAVIVFLAVRTALEPILASKATKWLVKMRHHFQRDATSYLLLLRLIPIFPFWVVNIVPGLLGVRFITFALTTLVGIIPGTFVYVLLGSGLGTLFDENQTPNLAIIFTPKILIPLLLLALLSLIPSVYHHWWGGRDE